MVIIISTLILFFFSEFLIQHCLSSSHTTLPSTSSPHPVKQNSPLSSPQLVPNTWRSPGLPPMPLPLCWLLRCCSNPSQCILAQGLCTGCSLYLDLFTQINSGWFPSLLQDWLLWDCTFPYWPHHFHSVFFWFLFLFFKHLWAGRVFYPLISVCSVCAPLPSP